MLVFQRVSTITLVDEINFPPYFAFFGLDFGADFRAAA